MDECEHKLSSPPKILAGLDLQRAMEGQSMGTEQILSMNGGCGEESYAENSKIQVHVPDYCDFSLKL